MNTVAKKLSMQAFRNLGEINVNYFLENIPRTLHYFRMIVKEIGEPNANMPVVVIYIRLYNNNEKQSLNILMNN